MPVALEIQLVAVVVAVTCALVGVFLVLRRMALMSDAISHSILLGIVAGFFLAGGLASPLPILGAAAVGLLTVWLVELVRSTGLVKEDAAIGLVFPALFSVAVLLIARYADQVHLDTDAVLLGELAFAPFRRAVVFGVDLGPRSLWVMLAVLAVVIAFVTLFFKELKITTFDPALAATLGFSPGLLHYAFMGLVSVTAVGAFDTVGSILVVALMIAPPAAAYLLTDRLTVLLPLAAALGAVSAIAGFWMAVVADASIAGSMATFAGVVFLAAFLLAPERGLLARARRRARQRVEFATLMLTVHVLHHEGTEAAREENRVEHLEEHLRWSPAFARRIVERGTERGLLDVGREGRLSLTERGRRTAHRILETGETLPL
ncbi:MAG: iron chelate uptake ABC transporter family permease subunit [Gemmatimonadota bacterium]|nr:iron chelate uptake ABC transporter family permease subunit [Gemmatimonadota bacterium]